MSDLQRLRDLFDELLEVPAERWEDWFAQRGIDRATRAELERLAAADRDGVGMLDRTLGSLVSALESEWEGVPVADPIGQRIGPFRLLERLGQGGMATVFLARREDADFEQTVALKLLRRDAFSALDLALFRRERQVLARLTHPNIARLIDGGVSEAGVPYLAMERVDGIAITRWCQTQGLGLRERIALLAKVARAVAAAHAALVVHRDIKPSNVLVGRDGEPKLLDFGIAKLLHADEADTTRGGATPMTPEYAAPEQFAGGPITTATDVYALGVLMYELLTGVRPARRALRPPSAQLAAARAEGAPTSTATRRIRGDLDKVVLMALAEEPSRRYASAAAFADDLERHLANQPVIAHPPSAWYRTRKFVQRHRGGVLVTALLVLGILASLGTTVWQARLARQEAARANAVRDFVVEAFMANRADRPPEQRPTLADTIATASQRLDEDTTLDPRTRAEVLHALADVNWGAADYAAAQRLHERALREFEAAGEPGDERALGARAHLAQLLLDIGAATQARTVLEAAPEAAYAAANENAVLLGVTRANARFANNEREAALADLPRLQALAVRVYGADSERGLQTQLASGGLYAAAAQPSKAIEILRPAIETWRTRRLPETSLFGIALSNLAYALESQGDTAAALPLAQEALALRRRIHTGNHEDLAHALSNYAVLLSKDGRLDEARALHEEAFAMRRELLGPDSIRLLPSLAGLAQIESTRHRPEAAREHLERARRICTLEGNAVQQLCAEGAMLHNLAMVYSNLIRHAEAEAIAQETLALRLRTLGDAHPFVARSWSLLAMISNAQQHHAEGLKRAEEAVRRSTGAFDPQARQLILLVRAESLVGLERHAEALTELDRIVAEWARLTSKTHYRLVQIHALRARAQLGLRQPEAARASATLALGLVTDPATVKPENLEFLRRTAGPQ